MLKSTHAFIYIYNINKECNSPTDESSFSSVILLAVIKREREMCSRLLIIDNDFDFEIRNAKNTHFRIHFHFGGLSLSVNKVEEEETRKVNKSIQNSCLENEP